MIGHTPEVAVPVHRRARIEPVDGLRAVAILAVVWFHVWQALGKPLWTIHFRGHAVGTSVALTTGQTGVNLFFVISGFCMYLMYADRQDRFTFHGYWTFIRRRILRIMPAFSAAALAVACGFAFTGRGYPVYDLVTNLTATQHLLPHARDLAGPFWSLYTEWHFYLILPVFIVCAARFGFLRVILVSACLSIAMRIAIYSATASPSLSIPWDWNASIMIDLMEFVWGMWVAWLFRREQPIMPWLRGGRGLILIAALCLAGRVMMSHEAGHLPHDVACVVVAMGVPVLTFGYALLLWNVISSGSIVQRALQWRPMLALGRWSYSMYLWHAYPVIWISTYVIHRYGRSAATECFAFLLVLLVMVPVSWLSFSLFENWYFKQRVAERAAPTIVLAEGAQ